MSTSGTYTEPLPGGGKLQVTTRAWSVEYYFSGPDLRYSGTFVSIGGDELASYVDAFEENWAEYERLQAVAPDGVTLE